MDKNILDNGKQFLIDYLKNKKMDYATIHPWRNSWEFIVLHSFRVEGYVIKILEKEKHNLTNEEILMTQLAAVLHDVGRIYTRENHALLSKNIVSEWLENNESIREVIEDKDRLLTLIEKHSNKEEYKEDFCLRVLRDADVLDEIGAMSIFMSSNWLDRSNPYFFNQLQERVEDFEISFCKNGYNLLNTETAKLILDEKTRFVTNFNEHLKDELFGTEIYGQTAID
jgi:HD superfamily phosphodiesterase